MFLYGFILVLIGIIIYAVSSNDEKKETEKLRKRRDRTYYVMNVKKKYPNAFEAYWGKADYANSVYRYYSNRRLSESCYDWSYEVWDILERDIQQKKDEERQKRINDIYFEFKRKEEELKKTNPSAYEKYRKNNPEITLDDLNIQKRLDSILKKRGNICP